LSHPTPWPSPLRAWYAVAVLVLAFVFSFIDRIVIALLVEPIKADLGISDFDIGLLQGFAFAIFYALLGIPIGRLSDRISRRGIIATGIAVWSLMTAACGLARSFFGLFLARVGVGVGEATLSPAAYSMISDYFPREKLGRALGVYQSGAMLGAGIAFLVGGAAVQLLSAYDGQVLPVLGPVRMWQLAFFAVGLPGLLIALLMLTVRSQCGGAGPVGPLRAYRCAQCSPISAVIAACLSHTSPALPCWSCRSRPCWPGRRPI
jgi:MFS family permease